MEICFLQHRLNTGAHNQKAGQICITQNSQSMISLLTGDWLPYLRPSLTAIILILYSYIIVITLGMTVDLHKLDTNYGVITYEVACYTNIRTFLNMYFLLIRYDFCIAKKHYFTNLSEICQKRK